MGKHFPTLPTDHRHVLKMDWACPYGQPNSPKNCRSLRIRIYTETRTPKIVLSDQGPNVDGNEIRDALRKWGIEKRRPYHSQGDGQSERGIQTTKQKLRCMLAEKKLQTESWSKILQEVAYSLNTLPSASTGLTPFKIMFGGDPNRFPTVDPANQSNARIDMNT